MYIYTYITWHVHVHIYICMYIRNTCTCTHTNMYENVHVHISCTCLRYAGKVEGLVCTTFLVNLRKRTVWLFWSLCSREVLSRSFPIHQYYFVDKSTMLLRQKIESKERKKERKKSLSQVRQAANFFLQDFFSRSVFEKIGLFCGVLYTHVAKNRILTECRRPIGCLIFIGHFP